MRGGGDFDGARDRSFERVAGGCIHDEAPGIRERFDGGRAGALGGARLVGARVGPGSAVEAGGGRRTLLLWLRLSLRGRLRLLLSLLRIVPRQQPAVSSLVIAGDEWQFIRRRFHNTYC